MKGSNAWREDAVREPRPSQPAAWKDARTRGKKRIARSVTGGLCLWPSSRRAGLVEQLDDVLRQIVTWMVVAEPVRLGRAWDQVA